MTLKTTTSIQWISEAAYYKAEARGFTPGLELDDWLAAENDYVKLQIAQHLVIAKEDGGVTILGLQELARSVGVENPECINQKTELIRTIQNAVGGRPCFHESSGSACPEIVDCQWKFECKKLIAAWCHYS
jgi:hypothetical protein